MFIVSLDRESLVSIQTNAFKKEFELQVSQYVECIYIYSLICNIKLIEEVLSEEQEIFFMYLFMNGSIKASLSAIPVSTG